MIDKKYFLDKLDSYKTERLGVMAHKHPFILDSVVNGLSLNGVFYECGVATGGSATFIAKILDDALNNGYENIEFHLFDTFNGMPETNPEYDNLHKKGDIPSDLEDTKQYINSHVKNNDFIHYHKGFIPDTFKDLEHHKIAFAHIDLDIYDSYMSSLNFIYPRLISKGAIIFDDYGHDCCKGAKTAVDDFALKMNIPVLKAMPMQHYFLKD